MIYSFLLFIIVQNLVKYEIHENDKQLIDIVSDSDNKSRQDLLSSHLTYCIYSFGLTQRKIFTSFEKKYYYLRKLIFLVP